MLVLVVFLMWAAVLRSFWGVIFGKEIAGKILNMKGDASTKASSLASEKIPQKVTKQVSPAKAFAASNTGGVSASTATPIASSLTLPNGIPRIVPSIALHHLSNNKRFLHSPVAKALGMMQCKITRTPDKLMFFLELQQCTGETVRQSTTPTFLLKGKKPLVGSNVYLSNNEHDQASSVAMRASQGYMGKLVCSKDYSEFCLLDNGVNIKSSRNTPLRNRTSDKISTDPMPMRSIASRDTSERNHITTLKRSTAGSSFGTLDNGFPGKLRQELLYIKMDRNKFGESRNREMEVLCPRVAPDGSVPICHQQSAPFGVFSALSHWSQDNLTRLQDKKAEWDQDHRVLNFHGRVTRPSIKNFQLEVAEATVGGEVVLQCGRTGRHNFIVDFSWPLSPVQAFSIALCKLTAQ